MCVCVFSVHMFSVQHLHAVPYLFFESEIVLLNHLYLTIYSAQEHTYMLASFFLPSHLSFKNVYMYMHV